MLLDKIIAWKIQAVLLKPYLRKRTLNLGTFANVGRLVRIVFRKNMIFSVFGCFCSILYRLSSSALLKNDISALNDKKRVLLQFLVLRGYFGGPKIKIKWFFSGIDWKWLETCFKPKSQESFASKFLNIAHSYIRKARSRHCETDEATSRIYIVKWRFQGMHINAETMEGRPRAE